MKATIRRKVGVDGGGTMMGKVKTAVAAAKTEGGALLEKVKAKGGEEGEVVGGDENGEETIASKSKNRRNYPLGMLALRWNAEIVAEKGSIIAGALISYLHLRGLSGFSGFELGAVAGMFFLLEVITDMSLVWIMTRIFDIPMLSASPKEDIFSKDALAATTIVAFAFMGMSSCVAMAASVEL